MCHNLSVSACEQNRHQQQESDFVRVDGLHGASDRSLVSQIKVLPLVDIFAHRRCSQQFTSHVLILDLAKGWFLIASSQTLSKIITLCL